MGEAAAEARGGHPSPAQRRPPTSWPLVSTLPPLAPFPSVPSIARAHLGVVITNWQLGPLAEDGELVVSELATNAVRASMAEDGNPRYLSGGRMPVVRVCLLSDGLQVLVEVHDQAPGRPLVLGTDVTDEGGRGLTLVNELAASWGWHPTPQGKCVWAVLRKDG
jgi:anti-sigma regulatory factor (Ser/Thr protein kinase)